MGARLPDVSRCPECGRVKLAELEGRWWAAYLAELSSEPGSPEREALKRRTQRLHRLLRAIQSREAAEAMLRG